MSTRYIHMWTTYPQSESWETALPLLSDEKREALAGKIEHWRAMVAQEVRG